MTVLAGGYPRPLPELNNHARIDKQCKNLKPLQHRAYTNANESKCNRSAGNQLSIVCLPMRRFLCFYFLNAYIIINVSTSPWFIIINFPVRLLLQFRSQVIYCPWIDSYCLKKRKEKIDSGVWYRTKFCRVSP